MMVFCYCPIDLFRSFVPQRLMMANSIVTVKIFRQSVEQLQTVIRSGKVNIFVLDTAPKPFHEYIVKRPAFTVHADLDIIVLQYLSECGGRELASLIRVEDFWRPVSLDSLISRFRSKYGYTLCSSLR